MTNPAAAALMGQWLKHGPIDLATAQALTRGYSPQERREAWLHYQRHVSQDQGVLTDEIDPVEELMEWLASMKSPADFAGFEFMHTREIQVEAYKSLPTETVTRIKPLITAYKANPDAYLGAKSPEPELSPTCSEFQPGQSVMAQIVPRGNWMATEMASGVFLRTEGEGVMQHYVVEIHGEEVHTHWVKGGDDATA